MENLEFILDTPTDPWSMTQALIGSAVHKPPLRSALRMTIRNVELELWIAQRYLQEAAGNKKKKK